MRCTRFVHDFLLGFCRYTLVFSFLVGGCASGPDPREREEQDRVADAKQQKQQRQQWLKVKAAWVEEAQKMQPRTRPSAQIESWKALLLVQGYPVEIGPIPAMDDVLSLLGPPTKKQKYRATQGGRVTTCDIWYYPQYKAVDAVTGAARGISIQWQNMGGQFYIAKLGLLEQ